MDQKTFRPVGDKVLLRRVPTEDMIGRLHVPDAAKEKGQECEVVAVGPGLVNEHGFPIPMAVKIGDRVIIEKWGGAELQDEHGEYVMHRDDEILAVVER